MRMERLKTDMKRMIIIKIIKFNNAFTLNHLIKSNINFI